MWALVSQPLPQGCRFSKLTKAIGAVLGRSRGPQCTGGFPNLETTGWQREPRSASGCCRSSWQELSRVQSSIPDVKNPYKRLFVKVSSTCKMLYGERVFCMWASITIDKYHYSERDLYCQGLLNPASGFFPFKPPPTKFLKVLAYVFRYLSGIIAWLPIS